jgi:hypothetical protein
VTLEQAITVALVCLAVILVAWGRSATGRASLECIYGSAEPPALIPTPAPRPKRKTTRARPATKPVRKPVKANQAKPTARRGAARGR